jgi:hypothetical protein
MFNNIFAKVVTIVLALAGSLFSGLDELSNKVFKD